ncbi:hypothetical protein [Bizionia paragorgiae]|uniref:Lipoprotein n=1 Tax=Bizionia paragorgiae TaxID=283786 RepID=A0A1H4DI34_BIZPA|nr:hypothetical protein [Bizionia paragorgiae]SEA72441.1 hypothetical protein SAMN04487990_1342 [Bizionia paragorgiae]
MKHLTVLMILIVFSCHSTKKTSNNEHSKVMITNQQCPKDGVCSLEVLRKKSITVKTDEFGNSYTEITENDHSSLLVFEYKRNSIEGVQDDNYQEFVYIELASKTENLSIKDSNLQDAKVTFVRLCFCKGQTGAYKVNSGKLNITKMDTSNYQLEMTFKVNEVPQVINAISTTFKM